jgi:hypothetical protein
MSVAAARVVAGMVLIGAEVEVEVGVGVVVRNGKDIVASAAAFIADTHAAKKLTIAIGCERVPAFDGTVGLAGSGAETQTTARNHASHSILVLAHARAYSGRCQC